MTSKAIVTKIEYAGLEFEGLMLPDGSYAITLGQICELFSIPQKNAVRSFKSLLPKSFLFLKVSSERNNKPSYYFTLSQFSVIATILMTKGNEIATNFVLASVSEKLERVFDDAFGVRI